MSDQKKVRRCNLESAAYLITDIIARLLENEKRASDMGLRELAFDTRETAEILAHVAAELKTAADESDSETGKVDP